MLALATAGRVPPANPMAVAPSISAAAASRVVDIYRLIDVRPYRQEFADGSAVVQLSAGFNAFEFPPSETGNEI